LILRENINASDKRGTAEYKEKAGSILGLARKAGALKAGTEIVIDSMRKSKACRVYISSDVSDGTLKKLKDKAAFYKVDTEIIDLTMDELAHRVGFLRPTAAVSLTDNNFLKLMEKLNNSDGKT
jgi:ribosomal protein L7Ae-like RNA K-turn-binding protein